MRLGAPCLLLEGQVQVQAIGCILRSLLVGTQLHEPQLIAPLARTNLQP